MEINEYPIDEEFQKWWDNYWAKEDFWNSSNIDISLKSEYNNIRKKEEGENPEYGITYLYQ